MTAPIEQLERLNEMLLDRLVQVMEGKEPPSAAMLDQVRQFLKQNGTALERFQAVKAAKLRGHLGDIALPFPAPDETQ